MSTFFKSLFSSPKHSKIDRSYAETVERTRNMVDDRIARRLVQKHKLDVVNLTWEDTARYEGSAVGPNISDMTLQVRYAHPKTGKDNIACMPVIRHPNFSDKTADVTLDDIALLTGNESGGSLTRTPLRSYLSNLRRYLSVPDSWPGRHKSLLAPKEDEVLVSAQACFLPIPESGEAEFNPVLFNYQSTPEAPAVLAIIATRQGTSATVIDNQRDGFSEGAVWGQRLFHNQDGERASFTATRLTDFVRDGGDDTDSFDDLDSARAAGLDRVLLIQVPLVRPEPRRSSVGFGSISEPECLAMPRCSMGAAGACDVEEAVIGHGEVEGPFTEIDGHAIQRDVRFPIRVTVQFYRATSNGIVTAAEVRRLRRQIDDIYKGASATGSLVVGADPERSTHWGQDKEPGDWWEDFWQRQELATGKSRKQLVRDLENLLGRKPAPDELEAAIRRVFR